MNMYRKLANCIRILAAAWLVVAISATAQTVELIGVPSNVTISCGQVSPPSLVTAVSSCSASITNGLILHYEVTGNDISTVWDSSGMGNHGSISGATLRTNYFVFDGTNDYLGAADSASLDVRGAITIAAWVNLAAFPAGVPQALVMKHDDAFSRSYAFFINNNAVPYLTFQLSSDCSPGPLYSIIQKDSTVPVGMWTHVATTWNGQPNSGGKIYMNGIEVPLQTTFTSFSGTNICNSSSPLRVGSRSNGGWYFNGGMDDIRIYVGALGSNQIAQLAAVRPTGPESSYSVPVALSESTNGVCPQVITRAWTATDVCNSSATATQTITIVDDVAPVLVGVPGDTTIFCGQPLPPAGSVTATDACGSVPVLFDVLTNGTCPATITRSWLAMDACGNSTSATQVITLQPPPPPVLIGVPSNITVACGQIPTPAMVTVSSSCATGVTGASLYFSFDTSNELAVADDSGNGHTGTVFGATWSATGKSGGGYSFNGTNTIRVGNFFDVGGSVSALTVSIWARLPTNTSGSQMALINKQNTSPYRGWILQTAPQNGLANFPASGLLSGAASTGLNLSDGFWHHWCGVFETGTNFIRTRLYIDGQLRATNAVFGTPGTTTNAVALTLGMRPQDSSMPLRGELDEVALYKRPLTVSEITAIYSNSASVTVVLVETTNGSCPQVITRVWTATDGCGGSVSATQEITVVDTKDPVLAGVPADTTIYCGQALPSIANVTATDDCGDVPVLFDAVTNGACPGVITRTWLAMDACGNSTTGTQVITLLPAPPPVLIGVPSNITVACAQVPPPATVSATSTCAAGVSGASLYYSFDTSNALAVADDSGNGRTGTVIGATWTSAGKSGGGYAFDGSNRIRVGNFFDVGGSVSALTVSIWAKLPTNTSSSQMALINKQNTSPYRGWILQTTPPNGLANFPTAGLLSGSASAGLNLSDGAWHHWCGVFEAGTNFVRTRLYIDGQPRATNTVFGSPGTTTAPVDLTLGMRPQDGTMPLRGHLDDVAIYQRRLMDAEIVALYSNGHLTAVDFRETTNGACPVIITRVWTATDGCGNSVSATQEITVVDATPPVLVGVPVDAQIDCGDPAPAPAIVTAVDDCDAVPVLFNETTNGTCPAAIIRTWLAMDACGNSAAATQQIRVVARHEVASDFDGDEVTDLTMYWPGGGLWYVLDSAGPGVRVAQLGSSGMVPVAGDYDGDGLTDFAVYHAAAGNWYIRPGASTNVLALNWGYERALAVPSDYDGDGRTDVATYVPETGRWYILQSTNGQARLVQWGWSQAMPVPADYDGDGKSDLATYVPAEGNWYIARSSLQGALRKQNWGWSQAMPVPADYDGDGMTDIATYVPASGTWHILKSGGGMTVQQWGWIQAAPVPGDYDGDGKADIATYHPPSGTWHILKSTGGMRVQPWGWIEAVPVMPQFQINRRYFSVP